MNCRKLQDLVAHIRAEINESSLQVDDYAILKAILNVKINKLGFEAIEAMKDTVVVERVLSEIEKIYDESLEALYTIIDEDIPLEQIYYTERTGMFSLDYLNDNDLLLYDKEFVIAIDTLRERTGKPIYITNIFDENNFDLILKELNSVFKRKLSLVTSTTL